MLTLPEFLFGESAPAFPGGSSFFRIGSIEETIAAYAEPIGR